jgi:tetraacyldisaccharide 4'-kinase
MFHRLRDFLFLGVQEGKFAQSRLFRFFSWLFAAGAFLKNRFYDAGILPTHRLSIPVISVGGIVAGGSGKTPLVHLLVKTLQSIGPIALLSRGYRAKKSGLLLGDEATLLSRHLPDMKIYIGKDRVRSGLQAIREGAKLILLDDGFQYRRLARDLELVAIDGTNPFGFGAYLPCGILRDSPRRLEEADALFINGSIPQLPPVPLIQVRSKIKENRLAGKRVGAFCAIASPHRFLNSLKEEGAEILAHWFLPDHEPPGMEELASFAARCLQLGASTLVCTEKDAVKLSPQLALALPIAKLEMELEVIGGKNHWDKLIEKIQLTLHH